MIELSEEMLEKAASDAGSMADGLDNAVQSGHPDSIHSQIKDAIDSEMVNPVLNRAKQLGQQHVGDRVQHIKPVKGKWTGDTYTAGIRTDNDVVLSHEYGSGSYTSNGPYRIEPQGTGKLAFSINGRPIVVDYVMHPGVRGKRFMQKAVREQSDKVVREAGDAAQQALDDALSN